MGFNHFGTEHWDDDAVQRLYDALTDSYYIRSLREQLEAMERRDAVALLFAECGYRGEAKE